MIEISDINDSRIKLYKSLKTTTNLNCQNDIFIADNEKVVTTLLNSDIEIVSLFAVKEFHEKYHEIIHKKINNPNSLFLANKEMLNQIVGFKLHKGIMAIGKIPRSAVLNELDNTIVILNNIINSENVGAIIRNAVAFDINSLIFDHQTSHPYLRRSVRVSMGNIFYTKIYKSNYLSRTIQELKKMKFNIIAAEICNNSNPINLFKQKDKTAIIFGNESKGIDTDILELCDDILNIPINERTQSINVASSSGIFFYFLKNYKYFQ